MRRLPALLLALWLLALPAAAHAFGVAMAGRNYFVKWSVNKVPYLLHEDGSADISDGSDLATLREGFDTWAAIECSALDFEDQGLTTNRDITAIGDMNGKNELAWIEGNAWPHGEYVLGVTGPLYGLNGIIVEADIGFNGRHYRWSTAGSPSFGNIQDVLNVAIHEQGHFFGLQHVLWDFDHRNPPTMAPAADPNLKTRTLEEDDKLGACFLYPVDGVYTCESHDDCGKVVSQDRRGQEQYVRYGQCTNRSCQMVDSPPTACGAGGIGDACVEQIDCDCVLYCQDLYDEKICTRTCMTDNDDCPPGFGCRAFNATTSQGFCMAAACSAGGGDCSGDADCCSSACLDAEGGGGTCAKECKMNDHCDCEHTCEGGACRPGENPVCAPPPPADAGGAPVEEPDAAGTATGPGADAVTALDQGPAVDAPASAGADAASAPAGPSVSAATRSRSASGGCAAGAGPAAGALAWLLALGLLARALRRRRDLAALLLVAVLGSAAAACSESDTAVPPVTPTDEGPAADTAPWNVDEGAAADTDAKTDAGPEGPPPWIAKFNQGKVESIHGILAQPDGVIVAGDTNVGEAPGQVGVAKIDEDGGMVWQIMIGGASADEGKDLVQTTSGFAVVGNTGPPHGDSPVSAWVVRMDVLGRVLKQTVVGSSEWESVQGGAAVGEHLVLAGSTTVEGAPTDVWVTRLDATDQIMWQLRAGGSEADEAMDVAPTGAGFVVVGQTRSYVKGPVGDLDLWVLGLTSNGELLWQWSMGGTDVDRPESVVPTSDGGLLIAGNTKSYGSGGHDGWLVKIHATSGDVLWQRAYGGARDDTFDSVVEIDGGLLAVGRTESFGVPVDPSEIVGEAWLVKMSNEGAVEWSRRYGVPGDFANAAVAVPALGGLVFAGSTEDEDQSDWMVGRLSLTGMVDTACTLANDCFPVVSAVDAYALFSDAEVAKTSAISQATAAIQETAGFARTAMCGR